MLMNISDLKDKTNTFGKLKAKYLGEPIETYGYIRAVRDSYIMFQDSADDLKFKVKEVESFETEKFVIKK